MSKYEWIQKMASYIKNKLPESYTPQIGGILGSGLGDLAVDLENRIIIPYEELPGLPKSTVVGHAGQFAFGELAGKQVALMQGRFHYYEGYTMSEVTLPIYLLKAIGINQLIITNAAGGLNPEFKPGDLMCITDHINLTGAHPLIGENDQRLGVRFPDLSRAYSPSLIVKALSAADKLGFTLQKGVYCGISGPAYMTPAELIFLSRIGGDAVGMSTVPEVIVARHARLEVLGISCITDMAIGEELKPLTHEEVVAVAEKTKPLFKGLVTSIVAD